MSFPFFLFFLPLIIIPIIIHFLSRKNIKKIDFPSLLFIVKKEIKLIRLIQFKKLLLLILRICLIVFLILAAANLKIPFVFLNPIETIIIDKSLSMEKQNIEEKSAIIVPNLSGIPQFSSFLKKHPIGILITDAQKNAFSEIIKKREKFPGITIKKVDFPKGNLAVIGAVSGPSFEEEDFYTNFTILNEYKEKKKTKLKLKSNVKIIKEEKTLLSEGINTIEFNLKLPKGLHQISLELEDEQGFYFDNKYYLAVNVIEKQKIYILSDDYPERLIAALVPSYFEVKWIRESSDIKEDLFIALNPDSKILRNLLENHSRGIICIQNSDNTYISNKIPDRISTVVEESSINLLNNLKSLNQIPITYNSIITKGTTLLYFKNGNPFINKIGNHIVLPISIEKNDLTLHPIFIPLLFNLINFLSDPSICRNVTMNESVAIKTSSKAEIISPKGKKYFLRKSDTVNNIFKETKELGFYKIIEGNKNRGLIAVNAHPSESKLESLSNEELKYIFGKRGFTNGASFFLILALLCLILTFFIEKRN